MTSGARNYLKAVKRLSFIKMVKPGFKFIQPNTQYPGINKIDKHCTTTGELIIKTSYTQTDIPGHWIIGYNTLLMYLESGVFKKLPV